MFTLIEKNINKNNILLKILIYINEFKASLAVVIDMS